jgi:predicted enzyme related to lactoylglutathione lyase
METTDTRSMVTPPLGSILLASRNPDRLRAWYAEAFAAEPTPDGFLVLGHVALLVDGRDDVADRPAEPARVILNFHVEDARAAAERLQALGATPLVEPEWRGDAWFATFEDPDGNIVQVIELSPSYYGSRGIGRLARAHAAARLPAQDLDRARAWYADKLDLHPAEEREGGLRYRCGDTWFAVFASVGRPSGEHTQLSFTVDDIEATVADLRGRGVVFEEYDLPGLETVDGITEVEGHYPSEHARGERGAWFHDSEGNLLSIGQRIPAE